MVQLLNALGAPGLALLFVGLLVGSVQLLRFITNRESKTHELTKGDDLLKKYPEVNIYQYKGLITNLSLVLSLGLILAVFEYPSYNGDALVDLGTLDEEYEEMQEIPPTEQKIPPPPKIQQPEIIEVADEEIIEQEIDINLDVEISDETVVQEVTLITTEIEVEQEEVEEIFQVVEESAEPLGGFGKFYDYIRKNMKYPKEAARLSIEGKVFVQFVVEKDGSISRVMAIKGIGGGCDEEAVRVVSKAGKWKPGKQRGLPVKQYMIIPITFKLS
jgi:protein TonB